MKSRTKISVCVFLQSAQFKFISESVCYVKIQDVLWLVQKSQRELLLPT